MSEADNTVEEFKQIVVEWAEENLFAASGKGINTNAKPAVGIRPNLEETARDIPYISSRKLAQEGRLVELDYVEQKSSYGSNMTLHKKMRNSVEQLPREVQDRLKKVQCIHRETGTHRISKRLQQVLIPVDFTNPGAGYFSLTPLCMNGIAKSFAEQAKNRSDQNFKAAQAKEDRPYGDNAIAVNQKIGGENQQNAGALFPQFRHPFVAHNVPSISESERAVYRTAVYGHRPKLTDEHLKSIASVIVQFNESGSATVPSWVAHQLTQRIQWIKRALEEEAQGRYRQLKAFDAQAEPAEINMDNTYGISKGLMFPENQDRGWSERFSEWVIKRLENANVTEADGGVSVSRSIPVPVKQIIKKSV